MRPPKAMPDYRMGDYAENTYFGPQQGPNGVWNGVNATAAGLVRWMYGKGAPQALYDATGSSKWLAKPIGFELLMAGPSPSLPFSSPVGVWKPVAPNGFSALGVVITPGATVAPKLSSVRVVADECVAACAAKQIWCDAKPPHGRCAPADGRSGGWRTAAYVGHGEPAPGTLPMNLVWITTNQTRILQTMPCVQTACLASGL